MRLIPLAVALGLVYTPAQADPVYYLDELVVTASRLAQPLSQTVQHTTVLDAEDIAASGAPDLLALLNQQAGVELIRSGGPGSLSGLFLRGAESDHVLVLVDGVRVASATTGFTALEHLSLAGIERIEIVRGNVSAVHGSDAIGGVIQIFTRQGEGRPRPGASLELGAHRSGRMTADYGGQSGATRFHLGAALYTTEGGSAVDRRYIPAEYSFTEADRDRDGYSNAAFHLNLSQRLEQDGELGLTARHAEGDIDYDSAYQNHSRQALSSLALHAGRRLTEGWVSRLTLGLGRDRLESDLDGENDSHLSTLNSQADWFNEIQLAPGQQASVALSHQRQSVSGGSTAYLRDSRYVNALSAGYRGDFGRHGVQAQVRHDHYSDFGGHTTGLLGYAYAPAPAWRLSASLSSAFKAPTFNELYAEAWGGNPHLKPEQAHSRELALQYGRGPGFARLTAFDTRTRDLIVYAWPDGNRNIDKARNRGLEASLRTRHGPWSVSADLTWQDPEDAETGEALLRRARRHGRLALEYRPGPWHAGLEVKASAAREDIHVTDFTRVRLPGYAVWNLTGGYELNRDWRLDARLENLLDRDYHLAHGYWTPGRGLFLTLRWQPE